MSIPPLVCSTPPPPDQCEDENEHEDFDIPYHLSQEDENDGYDYGNFTFTPNSISSESKKDTGLGKIETLAVRNVKESTRPDDVEIPIEIEHNHIGTNTNVKSIAKPEEDPNIEDLDLKINEEPLQFTTKEVNINHISDDYNLESSDYTNTVSDTETSPNHESSPSKDRTEDDVSSDSQKDISVSEERELQENILHDEVGTNVSNPVIEEYHNAVDTIIIEEKPENRPELTKDDDFGDFEDFQFANSDNNTLNTIESCDNPWVNEDSKDGGFGDFTANFDVTEVQKVSSVIEETTITRQQSNESTKTFDDDDDDDFGDFDDFKSSSVEKTSDKEIDTNDLSRTVPVLQFQMSDNEIHVVESLNKVLSSIFEEEISQPEAEFEGRLESALSVTWGHLKETDVRQPYILNWNNSLGQKSLLKALCIDSRNILFGPKWGYNPPKYAANMGMAPLQPKKPLTPSNSGQNENAGDKTSKPSNWVDSFTADGQESCSTENQGEVEIKPSNIEVFEAAISSKTDKIYSSTINVQPLRQISLPDTHIFTPTDSETPRSKTIHYDNGPPISLSQPVLEITNKQENPITQTNLNHDNKDDDDYWEFQDFRSRSDPTTTMPSSQKQEEPVDQKPENTIMKPNITYQTQVLQPVKMEPIMPTLNWPDPGHVKETFEDFSDFISNSSWGNSTVNSQIKSSSGENKNAVETGVLDKINDKHKAEILVQEPNTQNVPDNDDEFDTFKSALPPTNAAMEFNVNANFNTNMFTNITKQTTNQSFPQIANFDYAFPKTSTTKSDVISLHNSIPNEKLGHSLSYFPNTTEISSAKQSTPSGSQIPNMLQPTLALSSTTFTPQQNTGQILQPLSLESYSQINWPSPGIDLQDLSRFNPVETLQSLKTDLSVSGTSKTSSPVHMQKPVVSNQAADDDIWGEFVSSRPKQQPVPKKAPVFADDDEWTDFVSSPTVKPINGLNTISLNVHTNSNIQKSNSNKFTAKGSHLPLDIPTLNYITPKASGHNTYKNRHFENL